MYPERTTERLVLRGFRMSDASVVQKLAGSRKIAISTLNIPHPYEDGMAEQWIDSLEPAFESGDSVNFAICLKESNDLIGAIGLGISQENKHAELGYWIAESHWGKGYATEAANEIITYGFSELDLHRIHAHHMIDNPASGKVMRKIGMAFEGTMKQHVVKWNKYKDIELYGILKETWQTKREG